MTTVRLTQSRIDALKPRKNTYEIRDEELKGFGIRVLASGKQRYFVQCQNQGERTWRQIGQPSAIDLEQARSRARTLLAALHHGTAPSEYPSEALFETVAEEVFQQHARHWKPSTLAVNRGYLNKHILPYFAKCPIAEITNQHVREWFAALHASPASANRSLPVLSVIMREAEFQGYRPEESNPCRGIRRYRAPSRERFLSDSEIARIGTVLRRHSETHPLQVGVIALLMLTGCRRGEIVTLRWSFLREGRLFLPDSKVGPRTIWLSSAALDVLRRLPRKGPWIFPSSRCPGRPINGDSLRPFWALVCAEAGVPRVRLHDLRHSYASAALRLGESVPIISRLLGHTQPSTTLKYIHLADSTVRDAVETVGGALQR